MLFFWQKDTATLIRNGQLTKVKKRINSSNCTAPLSNDQTALECAIAHGQAEIARYLLTCGALAGQRRTGEYMEQAIRRLQLPIIELLLAHGDWLPSTFDKAPLLHSLFIYPNFTADHLQFLVKNGADINAINPATGRTVLGEYVAAKDNTSLRVDKKRVEWLVAAGANVNAPNEGHMQPLYLALANPQLPDQVTHPSQTSCLDVIEALLPGQPQLNPPLTLAAAMPSLTLTALAYGKVHALVRLLELGSALPAKYHANVEELLAKQSFSAAQKQLLMAHLPAVLPDLVFGITFIGKDNIAQQLLTYSAEDPALAKQLLDVVLAAPSECASADKIALVKTLIAEGFDINTPINNAFQQLPLTLLQAVVVHYARLGEADSLIDQLLTLGAHINVAGYNAFHLALLDHNVALAQRLATQLPDDQLDTISANGANLFSWLLMKPSRDSKAQLHQLQTTLHFLGELFQSRAQPLRIARDIPYNDLRYTELDHHDNWLQYLSRFHALNDYKAILKDLIALGWPVNKRYELSQDEQGSILFLLLKRLPRHSNIEPLLATLPDFDVTDVDAHGDLLRLALHNRFTIDSLQLLLGNEAHLNRTFRIPFWDPRYQYVELSYIAYLLKDIKSTDTEEQTYCFEATKLLLAHGASAKAIANHPLKEEHLPSRNGMLRTAHTLLEIAANFAQFSVFKLLLDYGADPHVGIGPFSEKFEHFMCVRQNFKKDEEIITYFEELAQRQLLAVDIRCAHNATPLLYAVSKAQTKLVQYLIEQGADVNAVGGFDNTSAIHRLMGNWGWVNKFDRQQTLKLLLAAGADKDYVDNDEMTPLMTGANFGCLTCVQTLLEAGSDSLRCLEQGTAIHYAVMGDYNYDSAPDDESADHQQICDEPLKARIIELLLASGTDINAVNASGYSALHFALLKHRNILFRQLLDAGADVNQPIEDGRTPLHLALGQRDLYFTHQLLAHPQIEASFNSCDDEGNTLLHMVSARPDRPAADLFKQFTNEFKIPLTTNQKGESPLHYAADLGNIEIVKTCLEHGVNVDITDSAGRTPLQWLLANKQHDIAISRLQEVVMLLITAGADPQHQDQQGLTPMKVADANGWLSKVPILTKWNLMASTLPHSQKL